MSQIHELDRLTSVFNNIMYIKPEEYLVHPGYKMLEDLRVILNQMMPEINCTDIMFNTNTDKIFFGIKVNPVITPAQSMAILLADDKVKLTDYQVEIDSKIFDCGLDARELASLVLFEISSMMDSYEAIDNVRALIDLHLLADDDVINLRDSVNYSQLIIYALKDTLYKVSSIMFKEDPEEIVSNKLIQVHSLEDSIITAQQKIISSSYGVGESVREPKTIILRWMFMIYKDIKHNHNIIKHTLNDAKDFTASKLAKIEIDKTLKAVDNIRAQSIFEHTNITRAYDNCGLSSLNELSLFKSLKANGLRSIEDAYYEYAMRIKNCETEEDAMYILRGINTRLNILEDYIYNTPDLSEQEKKRWETLSMKYRELREVLARKKIVNKKQYGLFFDYDKLDHLDD